MKTTEVLYEDLLGRIGRMKKEIESAEGCLADCDYLQCAVRLQQVGSEAAFDNLHCNKCGKVDEGFCHTCAELSESRYEIDKFKEAIGDMWYVARHAPELNMNNYNSTDVEKLNDAMTEIFNALDEINT